MAERTVVRRAAQTEIERLHTFLERWITGTCSGDAATLQACFTERLAEDFRYVLPGGGVLQGAARVTELIRGLYATNPDLRISIAEVTLHYGDEHVALVSYAESQRGARNMKPADHTRASSLLFLCDGDRLLWKHLQETLTTRDTVTPSA